MPHLLGDRGQAVRLFDMPLMLCTCLKYYIHYNLSLSFWVITGIIVLLARGILAL